jgi:hypothetical protein
MQEIMNSMTGWIHAGDETGPRHRALRRHRRLQGREISRRHQPGAICHFSLSHVLLKQSRVEAVDSKHYHAR